MKNKIKICSKNSIIKPDIIIEYPKKINLNLPEAVIYVRPETNTLPYEKAIIKGIEPFANVVYMANLNGKLFIKDALILEHYASQYRFAIYAKEEIRKYPEMINEFENHFKVDFDKAEIIGSFDAILKLPISKNELFNIFVGNKDFLKFYGQSIKKIKKNYIVNYDFPALLNKYNPGTNIFVIVILFKNKNYSFIEINQSIANELKKDKNAPIIDEDKFKKIIWSQKIKRTYHISNNHIITMFDMTDFVFKGDGSHTSFYETNLGHKLIENNVTNSQFLRKLKEYPIVYINQSGRKKLVNITDEADGKNIEEIINLFKNIIR
ncbi:MAG: hypothetical protein KAT05_17275 [Spirochaetes bacterium]|nr:hypothetical protein [Spirochaetota bacterium]